MLLLFWQRLLITIAAMLIASWLVGLAWQALFDTAFPSYLAGLVGGLATPPAWAFLKRIRPSQD